MTVPVRERRRSPRGAIKAPSGSVWWTDCRGDCGAATRTLLVALLLVLRPLASLVLVRVRVDRFVHRLRHLLLPALRDDQREVLVQILVAVQQLRARQGGEEGR